MNTGSIKLCRPREIKKFMYYLKGTFLNSSTNQPYYTRIGLKIIDICSELIYRQPYFRKRLKTQSDGISIVILKRAFGTVIEVITSAHRPFLQS